MTDIVRRLRALAGPSKMAGSTAMREAADEIERLEAALDDESAAHRVCVEMRDNAYAEIERLRGELEQYRERLGLR